MTHKSGLLWGFKTSFQEYVERMSGCVEIISPATEVDARYFFPFIGREVDRTYGAMLLRFDGSVLFTGHGGLLSLPIASPSVVFHEGKATLSIQDPTDAMKLMPLADLATSPIEGPVPASLTPQGSAILRGTYPTGTSLDPVVLRFGSA